MRSPIAPTFNSTLKVSIKSNPSLYAAVVVTILLQLVAIYFPPFQRLFGTTPLTPSDFLITLVAGTGLFIWVELEKAWKRRRTKNRRLKQK